MNGGSDLSICICTRNPTGRVDQSLSGSVATLANSKPTNRLVIVDVGSTDRTQRARVLAPATMVVAHDRNRGAAAQNTAVRNADLEWLFLDDDATMRPEDFRPSWSGRRRDQCVLPQVRGPGNDLRTSMLLRWRSLEPRFGHVAEPMPTVTYPSVTCFLLHRDTYWSVGRFDDRFFPDYFEDTAFGFQLCRRGAFWLLDSAKVVHWQHGVSASRTVPGRIQRALFENRWLFSLTLPAGWRRVVVVALELPSTAVESARRRSLGPFHSYLGACRRVVKLTRPRALPALGGDR